MTPAFTPFPVPTRWLELLQRQWAGGGKPLRLVLGPAKRPQKGSSASNPPRFAVLESVWVGWAGQRGPACWDCPGCCPFVPRASAPGDLESLCLEASPPIRFCAGLFLPLNLPFCSPEGLGYSRSHHVGNPSPLPRFSAAPGPGLTPLMPNLCPPPPFSFIHSTSTYHPPAI